jgi:hypothetical protein
LSFASCLRTGSVRPTKFAVIQMGLMTRRLNLLQRMGRLDIAEPHMKFVDRQISNWKVELTKRWSQVVPIKMGFSKRKEALIRFD